MRDFRKASPGSAAKPLDSFIGNFCRIEVTVRLHRSNKPWAATQQELVDKFGQCMQFSRLKRLGQIALKRDLGLEIFFLMRSGHAKMIEGV